MTITMKYDKPTALRIRNYLSTHGLTIEGVYGMMANIYSESGFRSNNAQNSCMTKLGMTDETYTAKVDNYEYGEFATDRVGYGLCQWTSSGRKTALLSYSKEKNVSIGNETMQLDFLMNELSGSYKNVLKVLTTSHDISECAKCVMTKFERPKNQSEENQNKRASYGLQLFEDLEKGNSEYMEYTNSNLVCYTKISPNKTSPRNHKIDTITIHCMAGNLTVERCGELFAKTSRKASSNYGVGTDGRIALYVEEKDRSWCSSNKANDHRAITIEVANDGCADTGWHVSDKAMSSLIKLVADICKRNNIKELKWSTNKADRVNHKNGCNMTVHRDYAAKACPGDYLYNKHGYIATEVNKLLGVKSDVTPTPVVPNEKTYTVQKGDTLSKIGTKTGVEWKTIATLNGIKFPYVVRVGQVLKLSPVNSSSSSSTSTSPKFISNGIDYSAVFDPTYYVNKYADLKKAFGTNTSKLFDHFVNFGMKEGRQAIATFNVIAYKNRYTDLQKAFGTNLPEYYKHYIQYGKKENRQGI